MPRPTTKSLTPTPPEDIESEQSLYTKPSKSQRKRDMTALQELGEALLELPAERLRAIALPEELERAVREARRITSHEGRRRQLQYIGRLMRSVDAEPIRAAIEGVRGVSRAESATLHAIEEWRDRLIDDDTAVAQFLTQVGLQPGDDASGKLRACVVQARNERQQNRSPRQFRELFRLIRSLLPTSDAIPP